MLLVELFIDRAGGGNDQHSVHPRGDLHLVVIEGVELNQAVHPNLGHDLIPLPGPYHEVAVQEVARDTIRRGRLEQAGDAEAAAFRGGEILFYFAKKNP